ncbi:MAG: putative inorganic carbon transporter subunit DabA [Caldilineaceae bacterium]
MTGRRCGRSGGWQACAAFIIARSCGAPWPDLEGRSFLHSYDWRQDEGFGVLELIMTAPMVVASWINLQYYASTVDNRVFGSGNKVLHCGGCVGCPRRQRRRPGVGLPWQSVHDGEQYVHEPLRLNVMIEAPVDAVTAVITKHEGVRQLLDNGLGASVCDGGWGGRAAVWVGLRGVVRVPVEDLLA